MDKTINEAWYSLYVSAVHLDSVEQFDKSLQQADLAILLKPDDWRAYGLKGQVLDRKISKLADEAGQSSEPAAERDSLQHLAGQSTKAALQAWADAHEHLGRSDWAKDKPEDYKQAMQIIRGRLLEGYYNAHDYPKTIHFADEVLKDDKQNTDAIQFKAFAFAQMASDTAYSASQRDSLKRIAVEALNAARAERKDYPPIIYTIGQFNLQLGDTTAALSAFDDYLKLEPEDRDARFIMGVIYLEGGSFVNPEKARDTFKALTEHHPEDSAAWINYGVALIRLGQQEEGKKAIEEGKRLAGE
jgi:Tfp pilus assembly protein PilF